MDVADLRNALETLLDLASVLTSGEAVSPEELASIDALIEDTRAKLKDEPPKENRFPKGDWVFYVERVQHAEFSISAEDETQAFNRAAGYLHDNIEALRFTWDRRDPYALHPLHLKREPETP